MRSILGRFAFVFVMLLTMVYLRSDLQASNGLYCNIDIDGSSCDMPVTSAGSTCAWNSSDCMDYCFCMMDFDINHCNGALNSCSFVPDLCLDRYDQCDPYYGPPCCEGICTSENYCDWVPRVIQ